MEYGNNGAEFNWSYMGGGGQGGQGEHGGQGGHSGQGMSGYPQHQQMSRMSPGGYGGGQQWLHSTQANQGYPQNVPHSTPPASYEEYNQSMMRYLHKSGGGGMGQMDMSPMGGSHGGYSGGTTRNGLGNTGAGRGHNANNGYSNW